LLFVAGLVLLAGSWRRILLTITGFTIAHSITLGLAALDLVRVAVAPTEAVIALSIMFLARELADNRTDTLAKRFPLAVASSFGLLHGFGFAAVLGEIGLPQSQIAIGLLFFNLGIELGQIGFVALLLAVIASARTIYRQLAVPGRSIAMLQGRQQAVCAYGLGTVASLWFVQRFTGMF
jgi:hypothetical protein